MSDVQMPEQLRAWPSIGQYQKVTLAGGKTLDETTYIRADLCASGKQVRALTRETLIAALTDEIGADAYDCDRVWEAWSARTMCEDDFIPVLDRVEEIADGILAALLNCAKPDEQTLAAAGQVAPEATCRKCGGPMRPGIAMGQTVTAGMPDDLGGDVQTMSVGGPGVVIPCSKCAACGWSVTEAAQAEAVQVSPGFLTDLIGELGREVYNMLDDCETSGPVGDEVHTITDRALKNVSGILDRIDALPFEVPGVILGPGAMLQEAIKHTFVPPAAPAPGIAEALHNLIACARPYMRDGAQMIALQEARNALRALANGEIHD